jgi:hypothetical protein
MNTSPLIFIASALLIRIRSRCHLVCTSLLLASVQAGVARWCIYFRTKIHNFRVLWKAFGFKIFGTFYDHLVYWVYIVAVFYGNLVYFMVLCYFSPFWYIVSRKIWQPWFKPRNGATLQLLLTKIYARGKRGIGIKQKNLFFPCNTIPSFLLRTIFHALADRLLTPTKKVLTDRM